jgi:Protein of unknown function (DUF3131)
MFSVLSRRRAVFFLAVSIFVTTALAQAAPIYLPGWELLRAGRLMAAAQEWSQASINAGQRKTPESLKQAAFVGGLATIAFEREGDNRAYSRWAESVRLYLEAGSSWERHRIELRTRWQKTEQALMLAGEDGAASILLDDRFLIDMVKRFDLVEYQGPKSGLSETRDGTSVSTVSPQYFAGAAQSDNASDITGKESRYASLSTGIGKEPSRQFGFTGAASFASENSVASPAPTKDTASSASDRDAPVASTLASGPVLLAPETRLNSLQSLPVSDPPLPGNPFGRGGSSPVVSPDALPVLSILPSVPVLPNDATEAVSNTQLPGFSRLNNRSGDGPRNPVSDISAVRVLSSSALTMPRLFNIGSAIRPLSDGERVRASKAWRYVQVNRNTSTGLVNGKDSYPVASVADFANVLTAYVAALSLQLVDKETFDADMRKMLATLRELPFYSQELFNREYDTRSGRMLDLSAKVSNVGGGWSAGDIGRLLIWLRIISNVSPDLNDAASGVVARLKLGRMVSGDSLSSAYSYANGEQLTQDLRLGEEQYAAAGLAMWGIVIPGSLDYKNARMVLSGKMRIPTDARSDAYISPDIFAKGVIELGGLDGCFERAAKDVLDTQLEKGRELGRPLMIADENLDQAPWFVYGTLWMKDQFRFVGSYDQLVRADLNNFSLRAAYLWAAASPGATTKVVKDFADQIDGAERGMFAGRYESGALNLALTLETNAAVLESLAYLSRGGKPFLRFDNPISFDCSSLGATK